MGYERFAIRAEPIRKQLHREAVAIANSLEVFKRVAAAVKLSIEIKVGLRDTI